MDPEYSQDSGRPEPGPASEPVEVPHTELAPDLLRAVIEAFVLREGTDYGEHEFSLDQKVARVILHLQRNEARILFDPDTESVAIVPVSARNQYDSRGSNPGGVR